MAGTKELGEVIDFAFGDLAPLAVKQLKDGIQFADGLAFYEAFSKNEEFKAHMVAAFDNFKGSLDEAKDLDISEVIGLAMKAASHVPKILEALK